MLKIIEDNPDADFGNIKTELKSTLSPEQYDELGIGSLNDLDFARQNLQSKVQDYQSQIDDAQNAFRKTAQEAIRKTRESYRAQDRLVKQSLKLVYDTGFSMIPRSVTDQVIATINERPNDYGFQTEIHLDKGEIGFNTNTDSGTNIQNADKVAFAERMNVMLGGAFVDVSAVRSGFTGIANRNSFQTNLRLAGMQDVGAAATILQRLQASNNNEKRS